MLKFGAWLRVTVVVPDQLTVLSGVTFCLFITLELSSTITLGATEKVKTLFTPLTVPVGINMPNELPDMATSTVPPPPFVTTAPEVKSIVVTFTTGVTPSVTVSELPEPPPIPAPVISISLLPRH